MTESFNESMKALLILPIQAQLCWSFSLIIRATSCNIWCSPGFLYREVRGPSLNIGDSSLSCFLWLSSMLLVLELVLHLLGSLENIQPWCGQSSCNVNKYALPMIPTYNLDCNVPIFHTCSISKHDRLPRRFSYTCYTEDISVSYALNRCAWIFWLLVETKPESAFFPFDEFPTQFLLS